MGELTIMAPDLFGGETPIVEKVNMSDYQRFKLINNYRLSNGPQKCKNCSNICKRQVGKVYYKCKLMGLSHSIATDIKVSHVCNTWKAAE